MQDTHKRTLLKMVFDTLSDEHLSCNLKVNTVTINELGYPEVPNPDNIFITSVYYNEKGYHNQNWSSLKYITQTIKKSEKQGVMSLGLVALLDITANTLTLCWDFPIYNRELWIDNLCDIVLKS